MQALLESLTLYALPVIFALTIPAAVQAYVANYLGDRSPRESGRLTFNPGAHIDLVGTIILPLALVAMSKASNSAAPMILIGWAKPLMLDYRQMGEPRRAMRLIALADPVANLVMAFAWAALFKLAVVSNGSYFAEPLHRMAYIGLTMNAAFAILMLIPILPYPGGRIVFSLLPQKAAMQYAAHERYGFIIVLLLFVSGLLGVVLIPFIRLLIGLIAMCFGL